MRHRQGAAGDRQTDAFGLGGASELGLVVGPDIDGLSQKGLDLHQACLQVADVLWVIDGPAKHGLDRVNWTYPELADHRLKARGIRVGKSAGQVCGAGHGIRPYRPTYRSLCGDPAKQAQAEQEAGAGELVLVRQAAARFPMVPTLAAPLGGKGAASCPP